MKGGKDPDQKVIKEIKRFDGVNDNERYQLRQL